MSYEIFLSGCCFVNSDRILERNSDSWEIMIIFFPLKWNQFEYLIFFFEVIWTQSCKELKFFVRNGVKLWCWCIQSTEMAHGENRMAGRTPRTSGTRHNAQYVRMSEGNCCKNDPNQLNFNPSISDIIVIYLSTLAFS